MSEAMVQMDGAGRVVLPKRLRDRFRLRAGDKLEIQVRGDAIEMRPTHGVGQLKRVNGVLVFTGSGSLETGRDFVAEHREERIDEHLRPIRESR